MSLINNINSDTLRDRRVTPAQGGHEAWVRPAGLAHLPPMPLYLTVAWWGLHLGRAFTRHEVSETFHITPRRASGVLAYIAHRCGGRICSEFTLDDDGPGQGMMHLHVLSIDRHTAVPASSPAREPSRCTLNARAKRDEAAAQREMARWVLSRPRDGRALAAWRAACPVKKDRGEGAC